MQKYLPHVPIQIERPVARNNGKYQFLRGYSGSGAMSCVHLTREEVVEACEKQFGPGEFEDDGVDIWWTPRAGVKNNGN